MSATEHERDPAWWYRLADDRVLARTIRELCYEGLLEPRRVGEGRDGHDEHELVLDGGVRHRFLARRSAWGDLQVWPGTVVREHDGVPSEAPPPRTARLLIDARAQLGLRPLVLGNLLEELLNTIAAEAQQCRRLECGAAHLAALGGVELEQHLDAHPKIIGNRGRLGWGSRELRAHAPEASPRFRLRWLIARDHALRLHGAAGCSQPELLRHTLGDGAYDELRRTAAAMDADVERHAVIPVHPWQWDRHIQLQYAAELATGRIRDLGELGDEYQPRASIRTLTNACRPEAPELKLSLTIMNTSCYRGIAAQHVAIGGALSQAVAHVVERDPLLATAGTVVLRDLAGVHVPSAVHAEAAGPYRYQELLAAIWRESAPSRLDPGVQEILAAALYQRDLDGEPLVRHWIERSGWSVERWLLALLRCTVMPLYHLLCAHGLGVIAHGQNVAVLLREGRPEGMVLRDFHGDVRLVDEPWPEQSGLPTSITRAPIRRPPIGELVHDLFTGHLVSVMRLFAPVLELELGLPEARVYHLVMEVVRRYAQEHPELRERIARAPLDRAQMERVCLNRARFRVGYGDLEHRPLPDLGPPLRNPLAHPLDDC
ncbi:IucA/IucC family protein [Paraliomyxa miuraensis]|uniref:IucA/IucC family protein n=1 Tax=Paraliomyxa miuraensis TaxID=376150 RepID=UPI002252BEDC|nr:IucA/IucC family protein [Paraliomyxa miuraensis]MCX4239969.1 hypothetical protein [Paraliomyxa miuraensis]